MSTSTRAVKTEFTSLKTCLRKLDMPDTGTDGPGAQWALRYMARGNSFNFVSSVIGEADMNDTASAESRYATVRAWTLNFFLLCRGGTDGKSHSRQNVPIVFSEKNIFAELIFVTSRTS